MKGFVDAISENAIHGWAHDPERPDASTEVLLFVNDKLCLRAAASNYRADLKECGMGDGKRAFWIDPSSFVDCEDCAVRLAFAKTGETLPNGRGTLSRSKILTGPDWDACYRRLEPPPPMERLEAIAPERWPLISVIIPNFNTPTRYVEKAVASVLGQEYPRWELCIADNCSTDTEVLEFLRQLSTSDPRIKVTFRDHNGGISASTNSAFELARGDYCALLDADDELTSDALAEVAARIVADPTIDVLYSDQDKCDEVGRVFEPFHKPAWSYYFFLGVMYVGHLLTIRTSLVRELKGCDSRYDKVQDFELMLRIAERTKKIHHIPKILYHWRTLEGSLARSTGAKSSIGDLQLAAVQAHLVRQGIKLDASPHPNLPHRIALSAPKRASYPKVSIMMPSACNLRHMRKCVGSILRQSTYMDLELILVVNEIRWKVPDQAEYLAELERDARVKIIRYPDQQYNFSLYNNWAAKEAAGDVLVFCNDDVEVVTEDWLEQLLGHLELPGVGAVSPLLLYPNGSVQHAGVVLGFRGTADHVMRGFPADSDGYNGSLGCTREASALTAACLMVRKSDYWSIGGMRESLATIYNDLDFCLRLRRQGLLLLYVASVRMIHHESVSRGSFYDQFERALIIDAYESELVAGDPYYNPNFSRNSWDYRLRQK